MAADLTLPISEVPILQDELYLYPNKKTKYSIKITNSHIFYNSLLEKNARQKYSCLLLRDVIGCDYRRGKSNTDNSAYLTIYAYPHKKKLIGKKTSRTRETLTLDFSHKNSFEDNQRDAKNWKQAITALINGITITDIQGKYIMINR